LLPTWPASIRAPLAAMSRAPSLVFGLVQHHDRRCPLGTTPETSLKSSNTSGLPHFQAWVLSACWP